MANPEHLAKLKEGVEAWGISGGATIAKLNRDLAGAELLQAGLKGSAPLVRQPHSFKSQRCANGQG